MSGYYDSKYVVEIITNKGNTFRDVDTIGDARRVSLDKIISYAKKGWVCNTVTYRREEGGFMREMEEIWKDPEYGFICQKEYPERRRYRISPNTGRLLDFDKYWKYL